MWLPRHILVSDWRAAWKERSVIRIVMADDHPMVREGIRVMLTRHADLDVIA